MKVLLVEDHDGLAKISCDILRNLHGYQVVHAKTGQTAYDAAISDTPDLILLDLSLPDMHGYHLAERFRSERRFDQTILVALTGYGLTGDSERSKAVGIDAHYRKPMDFSLLEQIKRAPAVVSE